MALKTTVKVGKISNLSDARYCSGMGVELLGFCADQSNERYVSPEKFQEMRGWFSGPGIVAEVHGMRDPDLLKDIRESYQPDFLEITLTDVTYLAGETGMPLLVGGSLHHIENNSALLTELGARLAYVIIPFESQVDGIKRLSSQFPVLVEVSSLKELNQIVDGGLKIRGVSLAGGIEVRAGFKDYGALSEILEALEIE